MRIRKPSPAMVVSIVALVMACGGSAVAAVSFAQNAGAVDHLSAVRANVSLNKARGRLVATSKKGAHKGQIPGKYLDLSGVPRPTTFALGVPVNDNAVGGANTLNTSAFGRLTMACNDQSNKVGVEDPTMTIGFTNTSPNALNIAHVIGGNPPVVSGLAAGTVDQFTINGTSTFREHVEFGGTDVVYDGIARQIGQGTNNASCLVVGTAQTFTP
ncbi:MAG: hypothetical protein QOD76_1672 [Solirubrobacteraceae bacterium]|nr:hypothetical protein [Solirubrobacteraceae bacterium]